MQRWNCAVPYSSRRFFSLAFVYSAARARVRRRRTHRRPPPLQRSAPRRITHAGAHSECSALFREYACVLLLLLPLARLITASCCCCYTATAVTSANREDFPFLREIFRAEIFRGGGVYVGVRGFSGRGLDEREARFRAALDFSLFSGWVMVCASAHTPNELFKCEDWSSGCARAR